MTTLRLGVLPWRVRAVPGLDSWAERLDREVAIAAGAGARMLVMPEYSPLEMATGRVPDVATELRVACALAPFAVEAARDVARRHGVWLLPGTMPFEEAGIIRNRAPFISPDGFVAYQDKSRMTRFEAELWRISPGAPPAVFETPFGRIGISICYDLEFPSLVRAQVEAGAWLILAPTCTDTQAGFNRVRIAGSARAMENQCFVAIAPTTGTAPWIATLDENIGAACVLGPVDRGFSDDGVVIQSEMGSSDWLFADLDPDRLQTVRREGAVFNHADHPPAPPPCALGVFA